MNVPYSKHSHFILFTYLHALCLTQNITYINYLNLLLSYFLNKNAHANLICHRKLYFLNIQNKKAADYKMKARNQHLFFTVIKLIR